LIRSQAEGAQSPPPRSSQIRRRLSWWIVAAVAVGVAIVVGSVVTGHFTDEANRTASLFAEIPRYPGAVAVSTQKTDRTIEESYVTYAEPMAVTNYYDQVLRAHDWQMRGHVERGEIAKVCYLKSNYGAAVTTHLAGLSGSWTFAFGVARDSNLCAP
jgi:hypothetical protein